jgi:hypothetical protein
VPHEQDHRHRPGQQPRSAAITPAEGHPRQAGQQDQAEQGATKVDLALVGAQESGIGLDRAGLAQTRLVGLERGPVTQGGICGGGSLNSYSTLVTASYPAARCQPNERTVSVATTRR